jgi:hypothetical protein
MDSEKLSLPLQVTRGKGAPVMALFLVVNMIIMAGLMLVYLPSADPSGTFSDPATAYGLTAAFVGFDLVAIVVLILSVKPARIDISRLSVTVTPLPVLGFSYGASTSLSIEEFTGVGIEEFKTKNGKRCHASLLGKTEKDKIVLDTPSGLTAEEFAHQLAALLKLKDTTNA